MSVPAGFAAIPLSFSFSSTKSDAWLFELPPTLEEAEFAKVTLQIPASATSGVCCRFSCAAKHYIVTEACAGEHPHVTPVYAGKNDESLKVRGEFTRWFRVVEDVKPESLDLKPIRLNPRVDKINDPKVWSDPKDNDKGCFRPIGFQVKKGETKKAAGGKKGETATPKKTPKKSAKTGKKRDASEKKSKKSTKKKKKAKKTE